MAAATAAAKARREVAYEGLTKIVDEVPPVVPRRVKKQVAPEYKQVMGLPPPDFGALWDDRAMAPVAGAAPVVPPPPALLLRAAGAAQGDGGAAVRSAATAARLCRPYTSPELFAPTLL